MFRSRFAVAAALVALAVAPTAAQTLGETDFPTSGAPEAQPAFERGLLLLHSFEYDDARDAFREARQLDPGFAMAAWGEAMTHNHPIWQEQDSTAAVAALAPPPGTAWAATPREAAYLDAARTLFQGAPTKPARDDLFAEAMVRLSEAFPDDLDAAAFAALAILGTAHEGRDVPTYMRAAAIAEEVFATQPRHPGAAHYLIHAYDDPAHAPLGLRAARVYGDLAPAASHALHMPTHIWVALGEWEPVAGLNQRSYDAAKANSERRSEALNGHGWHALLWQTYAELQRGRFTEARRLVALGLREHAAGPSRSSGHHLAMMRAYVVAETGEDVTDARQALDLATLSETSRMATLWADLALAADAGVPGAVESAVEALREAGQGARAPASAAVVHQADAFAALARGEAAAAVAALQAAVAIEDAMPIAFGPPVPVRPSHEALADLLRQSGRDGEALAEYDRALLRSPGRWQALVGTVQAASDGPTAARRASAARQLSHVLRDADPDVLERHAIDPQ